MSDTEVTLWLGRLVEGDKTAARIIFECYYKRLLGLARVRMGTLPRRAVDEEDIALGAFQSFCQGVVEGDYPNLGNRDDLWRLLATLTARKAAAEWKRYLAHRRGNGAIQGESAFVDRSGSAQETGLDQVLADTLAPDAEVAFAEQFTRLTGMLGDGALVQVALFKLDGHTNKEIAQRMDCALATVERRLRRIRHLWENELCRNA